MGARESKLQKLQISQNENLRMTILPVFSQFLWNCFWCYCRNRIPLLRMHQTLNFGQDVHSRTQCLRVWECARKLWETLGRSSQNLAIWASQRMLFNPTKIFCFFYIYFIAKALCCFGIRTEEIQLTALKNFQVSKALCGSCWENTVKRSQSQIWDLKFAYAWQLIKYFCGLIHEAVSETRMACQDKRIKIPIKLSKIWI